MKYSIIRKFRISDIHNINKIYKDSFKKNERFSLNLFYFNIILQKSKIYVLENYGKICAFIYLFFYKDMIFVLYLAVDINERDKGYGSKLLSWCLNKYKNKCFFLNIEEVDKKFQDYEIRQKRLEFYLKNNFYLTNYLSINDDSIGNILSNKKDFNISQYKKLDNNISLFFLTTKDKIKEIDK